MEFSLKGVPIHSRALQVTLREAGPGSIAFDGGILDLRKRGFVPVGGDLQGAGIIHQMQVAGTIDSPPARSRRSPRACPRSPSRRARRPPAKAAAI